ncbi:MAG: GGDEF domain-containing protein [Exilibacterium sp.]
MPTSVNAGSIALNNGKESHPDTERRYLATRVSTPVPSPTRQVFQHPSYLRLVNALQTTLVIEQLLELFYEHIQELVQVSGVSYQNDPHQLSLLCGHDGVHRCSYRLMTARENLGEIVFSRAGKRFSERELTTLETLIGTLIYPLRNAFQYRDAIQTALRDPLTGVGNRVALDKALLREAQMSHRYEQSLSMLMLDVDHFKNINDSFGHSCGDKVLCQIAEAIATRVRDTDQTFRYGGEEFVVLLSNTPFKDASIIAERIRRYVEQMPIVFGEQTLHASISIGYTTLKPAENLKSFFDRADRALYRAKQCGRNKALAGVS